MMMMSMKKLSIVKIVVALFALNLTSFFLYLSSHPDFHLFHNPHRRHNPPPQPQQPIHSSPQQQQQQKVLKPWPILPSYLPWTQTLTNVTTGSCEAYFGNGFTRRIELLKSSKSDSGWFRCYYSETLKSSICEGGRVRMWPEKIRMSKGGERIEEVIGRAEDAELPDFAEGAFDVDGGKGGKGRRRRMVRDEEQLDEFVPRGQIGRHTMRELIASIRVVDGDEEEFECDQVG